MFSVLRWQMQSPLLSEGLKKSCSEWDWKRLPCPCAGWDWKMPHCCRGWAQAPWGIPSSCCRSRGCGCQPNHLKSLSQSHLKSSQGGWLISPGWDGGGAVPRVPHVLVPVASVDLCRGYGRWGVTSSSGRSRTGKVMEEWESSVFSFLRLPVLSGF